jgi:hypothetical protein
MNTLTCGNPCHQARRGPSALVEPSAMPTFLTSRPARYQSLSGGNYFERPDSSRQPGGSYDRLPSRRLSRFACRSARVLYHLALKTLTVVELTDIHYE